MRENHRESGGRGRQALAAVCLAGALLSVAAPSVASRPAAVSAAAVAESVEVRGTVSDAATGEPIIGASVRVRGASQGTVTDADGRYAIKVEEGATLVFAYLGYEELTARVGANHTINVRLEEKSTTLAETVVVGYGSQKKVNLTGSVASVDAKQLAARPLVNVQSGIQGLMPGVTITGTNGAPGMDAGTINIRGVGTLNTSTPYILIDGVESGTLSSLDPNDIESISVLKDAASAAIYGSKAANGVILVTTKKGAHGGRPQVSYNGYVSLQNTTAMIDRLSSYDYASMYNEALKSEGKSPKFSDDALAKLRDGSDPYHYPNTDWYDLAYKTGVMQHHNLSVNGSTDNVTYMASAGYMKQTGVLENAGREQFNGRINLAMNVTSRLTARMNMAFIKNTYTDPSSAYYGGGSDQLIRQLNVISPWIVARNEDGTWGTISDGSPIAWLDNDLKVTRRNTNFTGLLGLDYKVIDGLTATVNASYVNNNQNYMYFQKFMQYNPNKKSDPNFLDERVYKWERSTFEAMLNYEKSLGKHHLKGLAGWHAESYNYKYWYMKRTNFPNNELTDMNAGTVSTQSNEGYTRKLNMISWFARANYDYAGRYLFEANIRADASSRFAKGYRWGYFPSFSAGWRVSEEAWMSDAKSWLSNLKLRASWGQLGNQEALNDYYPTVSTYNLGATYPFGGQLGSGYYKADFKITDISWEKSTTWGVGVDLGLLGGKLTATIDYYNRKTTGILMEVDVPTEFAYASGYTDNVGAMRNQGIELTLGYNDKWGDWSFGATANLAWNKNEILELTPGSKGWNSCGYNQRNAIGHPYYSYYLYRADGFLNSQQEADDYMRQYGLDKSNPFGKPFKAGDLKYKDVDGNGVIDARDREYCGSSMPEITFALNLSAAWRGFDVQLFFNGQAKAYRMFDSYEVFGAFSGDAGHPASIWKKAWTEDNHNAEMPRIFTDNNSPSSARQCTSDFWLQNCAYLRLKNLQVGYTLPRTLLSKLGIGSVRFYYSCENVFTIDSMKLSVDPEATSQRLSSYPLLRTHAFGVSLSF